MTVLLTLHPVSGFVITHENYYWLLSRMRIEDLLRCWPRSASVIRSHIGCRLCTCEHGDTTRNQERRLLFQGSVRLRIE